MSRTSIRRWVTNGGLTAAAALTLATGALGAVAGAQAAARVPHRSPTRTRPPTTTATGTASYRPLRGCSEDAQLGAGSTRRAAASANDLNYGGGIDGIGVTTGHEKVYLVFYGSQWGTQSTNGNGDVTLSGDPSGEAPYLQEFFKGLGTGGELWSGVLTQYCDGVAVGAQTCPASNTEHVAYPTGGALAGVWVDESTASPSHGDRPPARRRGGQRGGALRQHHRRVQPGRPVRDPVPAPAPTRTTG